MAFISVAFMIMYMIILAGNVFFAIFGKTTPQRILNAAVAIFMIVVMLTGILK